LRRRSLCQTRGDLRLEENPDFCPVPVDTHKHTAALAKRAASLESNGLETFDALELTGTLFALPSKQRLEDCRKEQLGVWEAGGGERGGWGMWPPAGGNAMR
jgi:hypothetical protein